MTGRGYPVPAGGTGAPTARTGRYSESSCGCPSHCTGVTVPGRAAARATGTEPEATLSATRTPSRPGTVAAG